MKRRILSVIMAVFFVTGSYAQEKLKPNGVFPVMSWGGIKQSEISVVNYCKLKEVGVNIDIAFFQNVDSVAKALDAAARAGIKLMISCPELKAEPEKTARRFKNHTALEGYYLADEPGRTMFEELSNWREKILKADNSHYCFVNLYPNINSNQSKFGTKDYREYVDTFDKMFPAPYLSFDFYPVVDGSLHPRWYENLEFYGSKYKTENRPFWAFALTTSYLAYSDDSPQPTLDDFYQLYKVYKPEKTFVHDIPTLGELRLQVNSNLAYGAQGIEYWSFRGFGSPLDEQGRRTVIFDRLKQVSTEIQQYASVFKGAKLVSVAHTGENIPNGTNRLATLPASIKVLETTGDGAIVSVIENNGNHFLVIINRDFKQAMQMVIYTDEQVKKVIEDGLLVPAREFAPSTEIEPGDKAIYLLPSLK